MYRLGMNVWGTYIRTSKKKKEGLGYPACPARPGMSMLLLGVFHDSDTHDKFIVTRNT